MRTIVVTGAGLRIGKAIVEHLAAPGTQIAVHYRSSASEAEAVAEALRQVGATAATFQADLTNTHEVNAFASAVSEQFGEVDLLVASAAVFRPTPWPNVNDDDWDFHLDTNLKGTFRLARAFTPHLAKDSLIITFGDWSGIRPYRNFLPYCVSKAGVIAMTQALAQEMAPRTRVNCICPGTIMPPESASEAERHSLEKAAPLQRIGSPKDILAAVDSFLASSFTTGAHLVADGGRLIANAEWTP